MQIEIGSDMMTTTKSTDTEMFLTTCEVEYRGRTFTIEFDENFFTPRRWKELFEAGKTNIELNMEIISGAVKSWTLPYGLTPEELQDVNLFLQDTVTDAMIEVVNPKSKRAPQS